MEDGERELTEFVIATVLGADAAAPAGGPPPEFEISEMPPEQQRQILRFADEYLARHRRGRAMSGMEET